MVPRKYAPYGRFGDEDVDSLERRPGNNCVGSPDKLLHALEDNWAKLAQRIGDARLLGVLFGWFLAGTGLGEGHELR